MAIFGDVWQTSNLRLLRLGDEKKKERKNKLQHENIMVCPIPYVTIINFLHVVWSTASSLHICRIWQSYFVTSLQVFFGPPLGLTPYTLKSVHFFTQSFSSLNGAADTWSVFDSWVETQCIQLFVVGLCSVGVSQTLRCWTEGATYIWQGGHHVGHWPTF